MFLRFVLLCAVNVAFLAGITVADDAAEGLNRARMTYDEDVLAAKNVVLDAYRDLISKQLQAGDTKLAEQLMTDKDNFEKSGHLPYRPELMEKTRQYGRAIKAAASKLAVAYQAAAKSYRDARQSDASDELQRELIGLRLPTKINSLRIPQSNNYVWHVDHKGFVRRLTSDGHRLNATFEIVPGLSDTRQISIRAVSVANLYMTHANNRIQFANLQDNDAYRLHATFKKVPGLSAKTASSFESVNLPGFYIRVRKSVDPKRMDDRLWLDKFDGSAQFKGQATFDIAPAQFPLWDDDVPMN